MSAFLRREFGQPPVEDSLSGADKLNNRNVAGREFGFDRLEDRRHLHRDQQCRPEALLGAFEPAQRRSLGHRVQGSARGAINDIGGFQCGVDIAMNHGPRVGIGVVNLDLGGCKLMLERLIFDPGEAECAGRVETHGLGVARHDLHRRDAALLHCRKESVSVPEGGAWPPQAEPRGVAQIFRLGRSGRGDIDNPGARQRDLQPDAGKALFGPLGRAKLGLGAGSVPECMRLVEQDDAVEVWPRPIEQLLQTRCAVMPLRAERRISEEDDPASHGDGFTERKRIERLDIDRHAPEGAPVPPCVLDQGRAARNPDRPAAATVPLV